jgi:2-succinyl-5-enolpyruvyl-6-hydroxy-3-cyclohexene-1-carboxylate synthase
MNDDPSPNLVEKTVDYVEGASAAARQAGEQVRQAGSTVVSDAREVGQHASEAAKSVLGTLKEQARTAAETQKTRVADGLASAAQAVHRSGESLEGQQDWFAQLIERGADEVSQLATSLRGADVQTLMTELAGFARRQPALFVGASMAVGFGLTRMARLAAAPNAGARTNGGADAGNRTQSQSQSQYQDQAPTQPPSLAETLRPDQADAANVVDPQGVEFGAGPVAEANHALR